MINSFLNIVYWLFCLLLAIGSGLIIIHLLKLSFKRLDELLIISASFGFILLIYGTSFFAIIDQLKPVSIHFFVGFLFVGIISYQIKYSAWDSFKHLSINFNFNKYKWLWAGLGCICVIYFLSAMAPILDGDSLIAYLDIPRRYIHHEGIIPLPYELYASTPLNMEMLSAFALLLRGDELAQMLVGFGMTFGAVCVIFMISRRYFSLEIGMWASLFFLTTHVVQFLVPGTKVNSGMAFFNLLGIYAICRWAFDKDCQNRWLIVSGIFTGAAFGCHYPGAFMGVVLTLFIGLAEYFKKSSNILDQRFNSSIKSMLVYCFYIFLFSSPWLIKNYFETGNPIYPVLDQYFSGRENTFVHNLQNSGNNKGMLSLIWDMSTNFTSATYGKPIGPVFLAILPGLLYLRPLPKKIFYGVILIMLLFALWYFVGVQRPRHFLTEIGIVAIISAWIVVNSKNRFPLFWKFSTKGFILLFLFEMVFFFRLHFINLDKIKYVTGIISREQFLKQNLIGYTAYPNWEMVQYINNLPKNEASVVSLYIGNDYYIDPEIRFVDSRMIDGNFFNPALKNQKHILQEWKSLGCNYVFINEKYLKIVLENNNGTGYDIIQSEHFKRDHLELVKHIDDQYLYRVLYN